MALLEDYYELVERDSKAVSPLWKGAQIVCYVTAAISGYISGVFFIVVSKSYAMNCFLFADLEFESNATTSVENLFALTSERSDRFPAGVPEIHTVLTTWSRPATCEFVGYTPLLSTIFGAIWVTLFCMCPRGGEGSLSRLVRPWRIVYPALIFSIMFTVVQSVSTILFHLGFERFCKEFAKVLNTSQCSNEINIFSLTYNQRMSATYENLMVSLMASYVTVGAWVSACMTLIFRFLCVVDFDFVKISVERKYEDKKDKMLMTTEPGQSGASTPSQESPTWSQDIPTHQTQVSILSYIDDSKSPTTPTQLMDTKNETKEKNTGQDLERGRELSEEKNLEKKSKSILFYSENRYKSEYDSNKKESESEHHIQFEMSSTGSSQQSDEPKEYELSNTVIDSNDPKYPVFDFDKRRNVSTEKDVAKSKLEDDRRSQAKKDLNKKRNTENESKGHSSRNDRKESVDSGKRHSTSKHTPKETKGDHYLDPNKDRTQSRRTTLDLEKRNEKSEKTKESKRTILDSENRHKNSEGAGTSHSQNTKDSDSDSEETSRQNAPAETASTSQQTNEQIPDSRLETILKTMKFFSR